MMKETILNKSCHSPSFTSLSSTNATDTTRRVRFNLESTRAHHLLDPTLKRFEQMYMSSADDYDKTALNSTVV